MAINQPLIETALGTGSNLTKAALGVDYHLSKRTKVYAHQAHFSDNAAANFVANSKRVHVGLDLSFC